jgi:hypothetical protein
LLYVYTSLPARSKARLGPSAQAALAPFCFLFRESAGNHCNRGLGRRDPAFWRHLLNSFLVQIYPGTGVDNSMYVMYVHASMAQAKLTHFISNGARSECCYPQILTTTLLQPVLNYYVIYPDIGAHFHTCILFPQLPCDNPKDRTLLLVVDLAIPCGSSNTLEVCSVQYRVVATLHYVSHPAYRQLGGETEACQYPSFCPLNSQLYFLRQFMTLCIRYVHARFGTKDSTPISTPEPTTAMIVWGERTCRDWP